MKSLRVITIEVNTLTDVPYQMTVGGPFVYVCENLLKILDNGVAVYIYWWDFYMSHIYINNLTFKWPWQSNNEILIYSWYFFCNFPTVYLCFIQTIQYNEGSKQTTKNQCFSCLTLQKLKTVITHWVICLVTLAAEVYCNVNLIRDVL